MICSCGSNEYKGENLGEKEWDIKNLPATPNPQDKLVFRDFEVTDEMAIDIGNAVVKAVYGEEIIDKTIYNLAYIKKDGIYWFARVPKPKNGVSTTLGGSYDVYIRKKDGAILEVRLGD